MVPAFNSENIGALGPLILVASIYEILGVLIAWIVKQFFWVPHRFRYGILVAGGWGNVGDLPTSVIMSITGGLPFDGTHDQTLSVAYISVFILVYMMSLFPMGAHLWVAKDFVGPDVEADEVREAMRIKRRAMFSSVLGLRRRRSCPEKQKDPETQDSAEPKPIGHEETILRNGPRPRHAKHVSFHDDAATTTAVPTEGVNSPPLTEKLVSPAPTVTATAENAAQDFNPGTRDEERPLPSSPIAKLLHRHPRLDRLYRTLKVSIKSMLTPASLAILLAFPIALIPPLKGLFVSTPGAGIPNAPDNQPPLAFFLDFTQFMGAASVPLGLIGLGSALARLHVPRDQWRTLPLGAIFSLAIGKMLISPVLGVLITQGLVRGGVIDSNDKVLIFVCMFFSCLPTATTQVFLTQVYSGTGSAEHLSPFLIPQYFLMLFSMTGLTAYALQFIA
ncbi:Protein M3 [Marasmius crinis-equi]|uniref:Protein M3 n=1 Tax=Marasmius crinis-equi TaxID=585013 RepID=A0ABR3FXZ8_9AGAR